MWIISPPTSPNWKSFGIVSGWHEWIHQILSIRMHRLRHSRPQCNGRNSNFPDSLPNLLKFIKDPHQMPAGSDSSQRLASREVSKGQSQNDKRLKHAKLIDKPPIWYQYVCMQAFFWEYICIWPLNSWLLSYTQILHVTTAYNSIQQQPWSRLLIKDVDVWDGVESNSVSESLPEWCRDLDQLINQWNSEGL